MRGAPSISAATIASRAAARSGRSRFLYERWPISACAQPARIGFERDAARVAGVQARHRNAGVDESGHAFVVHEADRHVARLQGAGRGDGRCPVGAAVRQPGAGRPGRCPRRRCEPARPFASGSASARRRSPRRSWRRGRWHRRKHAAGRTGSRTHRPKGPAFAATLQSRRASGWLRWLRAAKRRPASGRAPA